MIAVGCDHAGFELKEAVKKHLDSKGIEYKDFGCFSDESVDYPIYSAAVAHAVADKEAELGIICCGTGIGVSIAANKVNGIRAAACSDEYSTKMTRIHNSANILCLGGRIISTETALRLVDIFLTTESACEERHIRRVKMIEDIENGKM